MEAVVEEGGGGGGRMVKQGTEGRGKRGKKEGYVGKGGQPIVWHTHIFTRTNDAKPSTPKQFLTTTTLLTFTHAGESTHVVKPTGCFLSPLGWHSSRRANRKTTNMNAWPRKREIAHDIINSQWESRWRQWVTSPAANGRRCS